MNIVTVQNIAIGGKNPLALIAGPCVIEDFDRTLKIGKTIKALAEKLHVPYIFKASFDKANRSSIYSFRGPGLTEGLAMLKEIKRQLAVPVGQLLRYLIFCRFRPFCADRLIWFMRPPRPAK